VGAGRNFFSVVLYQIFDEFSQKNRIPNLFGEKATGKEITQHEGTLTLSLEYGKK